MSLRNTGGVLIVHAVVLAAVVSLGAAEPFSIIGASGVTATGKMRVTGNVGAGSGAVTGVAPEHGLGEVMPAGDALKDVAAAEKKLASLPASPRLSVFDGGADDVWVIPINGNLTTDPASSMQLLGSAQSSHIFWLVTGDATLGEQSSFAGTLIAQNITVHEGVTVSGRLIARQGTVTLVTDDINLCCSPIAQSALPNGMANVPYHAKIFGNGGTAPHTFKPFSGSLPAGLTLAEDGTVSGVPAAAGTSTFIVLVTDYKGCTSIHTYTIRICDTATFSPLTLLDAAVGAAYSATITASKAQRLTATRLPDGLTLTTDACGTKALLCGTPRNAGIYKFTLTGTDCDGNCSSSIDYTIRVSCPAITLSPPSLAAGTVGTAYQQVITASGSLEPYHFESEPPVVGPTGVLSFTPTQTGTFNVAVKATDAYGCSGSRAYSVAIGCPAIAFSPIDDARVNTPYSAQLPGPYTFTATQLPAWLTLSNSGLLSGTPPTADDVSFTVTATAAPGCSEDHAYTLHILGGICPAIIISPTTLSRGTLFVPYSKTISVTGGTPPYIVSVSGPIPPGLTPPLMLSGTPTAVGVYTFTVTVTDAHGCFAAQTYTVAISQPAPPGIIVPTLSQWAIVMLAMALAGFGFMASRKLS